MNEVTTTAYRLFKPMAEQGMAEAQFILGLMYDNGRGVPQDYAMAVKWYRKAAEQGIAKAQFNLGISYEDGQGVPRNYILAYKVVRPCIFCTRRRRSGESHKKQKQVSPPR